MAYRYDATHGRLSNTPSANPSRQASSYETPPSTPHTPGSTSSPFQTAPSSMAGSRKPSPPNVSESTDPFKDFASAIKIAEFKNLEWINIFFTTLRIDRELMEACQFEKLTDQLLDNIKHDWLRDHESFYFYENYSKYRKIVHTNSHHKNILHDAYKQLKDIFPPPLIKILFIFLSQTAWPQKIQAFTNWCLNLDKIIHFEKASTQEFYITFINKNTITVLVKSLLKVNVISFHEADNSTSPEEYLWTKFNIELLGEQLRCTQAEFRVTPTPLSSINTIQLFKEFLNNITNTESYEEYVAYEKLFKQYGRNPFNLANTISLKAGFIF